MDANNLRRVKNFKLFLDNLDSQKYYTEFCLEGAVNYAFVILLRQASPEAFQRLTNALRKANVEFRRGTAGGGNLTRQPFIREQMPDFDPTTLKNAEFIHSYGLYTGNYPDLEQEKILGLCELLNSL